MSSIFDEDLKRYEERYCSYGDTVHYNEPIKIFSSSEPSCYLTDNTGNRYFDFQMMYSSVNFGYQNSFFNNVLKSQLDSLPQLASEFVSKDKIILSKEIAQSIESRWNTPGRVHFNVGGSQAIDDSLKLVAINKGSRRVFAFEGSYHGRTIGASAITSSYRYRKGFGEFGTRAHLIPYPYCFRCPYGKHRDSCELFCVGQVERIFESEYQGVVDTRSQETEFSAFYVEPIQGTGGYIVPPEGYFSALKKVLDKYNILFVVDEIQMGLYRTGKLWSIEHFGVEPDILVFGKSLTNGLNPLSGLWSKESLISPDIFPPGSTHSTFSNNPLGMALGLATFDWIRRSNYSITVPEKGAYLTQGLLDLKSRHSEIGDVGGLGLAARIEICFSDGITPNRKLTETIHKLALEHDVVTPNGENLRLILDIGGYYKNVFTLAPYLDITKNEIDNFLVIFETILIKAKGRHNEK